MTRQAVPIRLPWQERWSEPSLEQLLSPLSSHHTKILNALIEQLEEMPGVQRSIIWYGAAWKWTIHYTLTPAAKTNGRAAAKPAEPETICYLVPRVESPIVCLPMSDSFIQQLPMTRLSKFVRDGIKISKCAVAIHWVTWTPTAQSEVIQIIDLLKRRHKLANPKESTGNNGQGSENGNGSHGKSNGKSK